MIAVLLIGCTTTSFASSTEDLEALRTRALEMVNQARREAGLKPLELGSMVNEAALSHAADMLRRDYYSHTSPSGETVQDRYIAAGGNQWRLTAENIARCAECTSPPDIDAVERLHRGWMQSPGHRDNILRRGLTQFGFGIVSGPKQGQYAVQTFSGPGVPRGLKSEEDAVAIPPVEQTAIAISAINDSRSTKDRSQLQSSAALTNLAQSILPERQEKDFQIDQEMNLYSRLPASQRGAWRSISALVATCGGCGTEATAADVRFFVEQWLEDRGYREKLLNPQVTHLSMVVATDSKGKKIGVAVLGQGA